MSGVIDDDGQQWEHCNHCGEFIEIEKLRPGWSTRHTEWDAVDLCPKCQALKMEKPP